MRTHHLGGGVGSRHGHEHRGRAGVKPGEKIRKIRTAWIKSRPNYSEKWVHRIIADDPSMVEPSDLILRDPVRVHPRAGRLDLVLQDADKAPV